MNSFGKLFTNVHEMYIITGLSKPLNRKIYVLERFMDGMILIFCFKVRIKDFSFPI